MKAVDQPTAILAMRMQTDHLVESFDDTIMAEPSLSQTCAVAVTSNIYKLTNWLGGDIFC